MFNHLIWVARHYWAHITFLWGLYLIMQVIQSICSINGQSSTITYICSSVTIDSIFRLIDVTRILLLMNELINFLKFSILWMEWWNFIWIIPSLLWLHRLGQSLLLFLFIIINHSKQSITSFLKRSWSQLSRWITL